MLGDAFLETCVRQQILQNFRNTNWNACKSRLCVCHAQPVAAALDKLQGEKAAYFGNILLYGWKAWRGGSTKN